MDAPRVLVAYGSKNGSTAEIAEWIAETIRQEGFVVDVEPAFGAHHLAPYAGVVLGGALYAGRWHAAARRFARRYRTELADRPVWLFSSGPLDRSADHGDIPPVTGVARIAAAVGARGHRTFGGRLAADPPGFIARSMAKRLAGDYRDRAAVAQWARGIAAELATAVPHRAA